ncbi:MAG: type II toxin-antitoxin system RelE/ParE family toxin [Bacteroidetes bacterium]|nr:type II toxin-antitoxin system RelE/ParE family toxin [Bacteroidota bacterium]
MAGDRNVYWSGEAKLRVDQIKEFLRKSWSEREVSAFLDLLQEFETLIKQFPNGYQASVIYPGCRRAVIHPNVSVVYKVSLTEIEVVTVYDNRSARSQAGEE